MLVLGCLVPRAAMALKLDALCNDAVFYIELARNFEQGHLEAGLGRLGLNTYPPILAALHHFGLNWESAGKWWGVFIASLAVLPLYGWVRRQFDGRTALVAAILYAFHPKLIEWSPELLRDPTFWFLWTFSLYASWRAAAEVRLGWYAVAGLSIGLAAHTRFEGWFLYVPLVGWSACRFESPRPLRKIAAGALLSALVSPLLVLSINVTALRDQPRWELGNFDRLGYVALWWGAIWKSPEAPHSAAGAGRHETQPDDNPVATASSAISDAGTLPARMSAGKMLRLYGNALRRGFGALFGLAWLVGFGSACQRLLRADHAVLFIVAACVAAAAWVHLWYAQATSSRYFLAIVLLACPCAAAGWLWVYDQLTNLLLVTGPRREKWLRPATACAAVLATLVAGVGESLADRHDGRSREAALGRWLLAELGPGRQIATLGPMPLIGFYAQAATDVLTINLVAATEPWPNHCIDALVASRRGAASESLESVVNRAASQGYRRVKSSELPAGHDWSDMAVFVAFSAWPRPAHLEDGLSAPSRTEIDHGTVWKGPPNAQVSAGRNDVADR